jgi:phage terminase small subunit
MMAKKAQNLTLKQARFAEEYLIDGNATQAAIRAGYSKVSAKVTGCQNLTKANIAAEIAKGRAARSLRTQVTADDVVQRLQLLATAELPMAASWDGVSVDLVESENLSPAARAAVRSVKMGQYGPEIRFSDPAPYLRMLGEHTGLFEAGQQQAQMIQVNIVVDDKREVKQ